MDNFNFTLSFRYYLYERHLYGRWCLVTYSLSLCRLYERCCVVVMAGHCRLYERHLYER